MAGGGGTGCAALEGHGDVWDVLRSATFLFLVWVAGRVVGLGGLPPLAGEIVAGMLLGPQLADIVPFPAALQLIGELGLLLMVIEAGFEIDLNVLKQIGGRAVGAALVGMLCGAGPLAFGVAKALGLSTNESLSVAASLAPCSTGVALVVLKRKRVVNTPTGQLIVATAFVEDIVALILLSELRALENPTGLALFRPVGVSLAFATAVGGAAVFVIPHGLSRFVLPYLRADLIDSTLLLLLFIMAGSLIAALSAGGASGLMGAFLAGLSFCTIRSVEHVWKAQVKRLQTWLIRIFFSATIGFDVPVRLFSKVPVLRRAAVFWAATFGKLLAGLFAVPLALPQATTLGLAMASLGEFSFIVGKSAKTELKLMSEETYAAVTLAVLATIVISPTLLGYALDWQQRRAQAAIADAAKAATSTRGGGVCYYKLDVKVTNRWGLLGDINRCMAAAGVDVIEFRVDLRGDMAIYEAYLKDCKLRAPRPGAVTFPELATRMLELRTGLMTVLSHDPKAGAAQMGDEENAASTQTVNFAALRGLKLERWMPGAGPEEWEENGLEENEGQATLIMRREAENKQRSVFDIFGGAALAGPALRTMPRFDEKEDECEEVSPRPSLDVPRRPSLDAPRRLSLDSPATLPRQPSLARGASLAAAMAAMAAHTQAGGGAEAVADDSASSPPPAPAVEDAFGFAAVDRAIERARMSAVLSRRAEEEDARGLLGNVRRHKARGLEPETGASPSLAAAAAPEGLTPRAASSPSRRAGSPAPARLSEARDEGPTDAPDASPPPETYET